MRARVRLLGVLVALCAAVTLALFAGAASAKIIHPLIGEFGEVNGQIMAVGVEQSTGDVYVDDGILYKYDAAGNPVNFSSTGTNTTTSGVGYAEWDFTQIAIDESGGPANGDIYLTGSVESLNIDNASGAQIGSLSYGEVQGGFPCGVAVDKAGNVYVGTYEGYVDKYHAPTTVPLTSSDYETSMYLGGSPCNLVVDSAGNVYVSPYGSGGVTRYEPSQFGSLSPVGNLVDSSGYNLAVDPVTNEVYVNNSQGIFQYGPHGEPFGEPLFVFARPGEEGGIKYSMGVGVNGATDDVYVSGSSQSKPRKGPIEIFGPAEEFPEPTTGSASNVQPNEATLGGTVNPEGVKLEECFFEYGETMSYGETAACAETPAEIGSGSAPVDVHAKATGLAIGTTYHFRLSIKAKGVVLHGGDGSFITPQSPLVQETHAISVRTTNATVGAEIDPRHGLTRYRFEYGTSASYDHSVPVPDASAGSGGNYLVVTAGLTGLQSGTTYHFRIVASNVVGDIDGPDTTFTTEGTPAVSHESCPNATVRGLQGSEYLPDCRAYEMVSPNDKNGGGIAARTSMTQAAVDGNAIKYASTAIFGDARGSEITGGEYIAQRGTEGWDTHSINPLQNSVAYVGSSHQKYEYFTPNLEEGIYHALSPVIEGFPNVEKNINLYLRSDALTAGAGSYQLLSDSVEALLPRPVETNAEETAFAGASRDMSHIIFESFNDLTTTAKGLSTKLPKLYEWHGGEVTLVGILPNGEAAAESTAGAGAGVMEEFREESWTQSAISADGARVIFTASPKYTESASGSTTGGTLYMRIDGKETVEINESERTDCNVKRKEAEPSYKCIGAAEPDPNGQQFARFWYASEDGSKVFFTTAQLLTDEARGGGLYVYDAEAPAGKRLTLLALGASMVAGISKNGSYVYFTAGEQLSVWHEGATRLVATRVGERCAFDKECWGDGQREWGDTFRITPDGRSVAFASNSQELATQLGFVMPGSSGNGLYREVYVYNYGTGVLTCASCNRVGLPLSANAGVGAGPVDGMHWFQLVGATTMYQDRPLSEDGRYVFFDTSEALVSQDTNGERDVYEYDTVTGQVHLITSGTCACESVFVDASPDGSNAFVVTSAKLVAGDQGTSADLYDARVNGGFVAQSVAPPALCAGEECQPPGLPAPQLTSPSSSSFVGVGNQIESASSSGGKATRGLTHEQQLARALKTCAKKPHKKRAKCRARARRRYGAKSAKTRRARSSKHRRGGRS